MGLNAFQSSAFQQLTGTCAFQELIAGGGDAYDEDYVPAKHWRYKPGSDTVWRHIAAITLGQKGGSIGGPARAAALSASQLSKAATHAANSRWRP